MRATVGDSNVAAVSSKSGASVNVYNASAMPDKPPVLVHYMPLDVKGNTVFKVQVPKP